FHYFFFSAPPTTLFSTLSLHDALPISRSRDAESNRAGGNVSASRGAGRSLHAQASRWLSDKRRGKRDSATNGEWRRDSSSSRCRSEEHTSELQSLAYLVCRLLLEKKKQ